MKFTTNLATRIYINTRQLKVFTLLAVMLLAVLLMVNIRNIGVRSAEAERIGKETAQLDARRQEAGKHVSEKDYQNLLARISFANETIDKKTYNWLTLLDRLETVVPEGLAISSIEPDQKSHGVKLSGVARSFANLRTLMENLESSDFFSEVYLLSQAEAKLDDDGPGITFNLSCKVAMQ